MSLPPINPTILKFIRWSKAEILQELDVAVKVYMEVEATKTGIYLCNYCDEIYHWYFHRKI